MQSKNSLLFLLSLACLFLFVPANAHCSAEKAPPCEDVQHAVNLNIMEKSLLQPNSQAIAELDDKAREWFETFQEGGMLFDGWKEISDEVVQQVPDEQKLKTKATMVSLGVRIGCEWSKENDVRKISTSMLKKWGKQLRQTVATAPVKIPVLIHSIESEVDGLLL